MNELKPATANQMFLAKMAGMDVKTPKPVTVDQMFMQKIIENGGTGGGGGGVSSWNDLTDKPFGTEVTEGVLTFDGDLTGKETIVTDDMTFVKMSDEFIPKESFDGITLTYCYNGTLHSVHPHNIEFVEEGEMAFVQVSAGHGMQTNATIRIMSTRGVEGVMGLPDGTYFIFYDEKEYTISASCLTGEVETIKPLDEKYLPGPKLLGEIVLTNENCTAGSSGGSDNYLLYDDELKQQAQAILDACKTQTVAPVLAVNIADFQGVFNASYYGESAALSVSEAIQFSLYIEGLGLNHIRLFRNEMFAPSFITGAVAGGYPMTIKVYAT